MVIILLFRNQTSAKIEGLNQKYECYKVVSDKIDNLNILAMSNVISVENMDKFCDMLIDMQNSFSTDYPYIKPSKYKMKYVNFIKIRTWEEIHFIEE
jgi:hypothetical protein